MTGAGCAGAAAARPDQRPSMGQNMAEGRRTEIECLTGFVVCEGKQVGISSAPTSCLSTSSRRSSAASSNRTRTILRNCGSTEPDTKTQVVVPEATPDGCGLRPDDRFRNLQRP